MTRQFKISNIITALWLFCVALPAGAISLGNTGADVRAYEYDRTTSDPWLVDVYNLSASSSASYNTGAFPTAGTYAPLISGRSPYSNTAAYAGSSGLRTFATAMVNRTASSYASMGDTYIVRSDIYAVGTATTLNFALRLDGILDVDTYYQGASSWADVSAGFLLQDPTIGVDEEGFVITPLVEFNMDSWYHDDHSSVWQETYLDYGANWSLLQNDIQVGGDSVSSFDVIGDNQTSACLGPDSCTSKNFDTGLLTLSVDTYVGAELQWLADIDLFLQAYEPDAYAYADFGNSFKLSLTSSDPDVWLDGTYALNSAVPIPAGVWLFGSGLIGLIAVARRGSGTDHD